MNMITHFIFLLLALMMLEVKSQDSVIVELPLGQLEGGQQTSLNGRRFFAFEGVPYAEPPTGNNRFRDPIAKKAWNGLKTANMSIWCLQYNMFTAFRPPYQVQGQEDCLVLNIYSPNLNKSANLDVIVFFHGGGFSFGNGIVQGPRFLLDKNVVYINMNYRLGPLGFLCTEDEIVGGNMGLKDQIMALQWIKEYVEYFGGNKNSITITGMSAGGASVHFHYLSPQSKGLFNRGISQSGTMLNNWVLAEASLEKAKKLIQLLNCTENTMEESIDCLRSKPGEEIVVAVQQFLPFYYNPFTPFGIVIDNWSNNSVLPEHPVKLIKKGRVQNLPWIAAYANSEGIFPGGDFYHDDILNQIDTHWNEVLPSILDYTYTVAPKQHNLVSQQIRDYYMQNRTINKESYNDFIQILTDRLFVADIVKTVKMHAATVKSPTRLYMFSYRGANSLSNIRANSTKDFGAAHMDDSNYVFNSLIDTTTTVRDRQMIKVFVEMFTSFARTGNPNVGVKWPLVRRNNLKRLHIAGPQNLIVDTERFTNATFWNSLPICENEKFYSYA